jgi:hypothetical protein
VIMFSVRYGRIHLRLSPFMLGMSATREDATGVPSAATTRPDTVHGGGALSAGLEAEAGLCTSRRTAAAWTTSADSILHQSHGRISD